MSQKSNNKRSSSGKEQALLPNRQDEQEVDGGVATSEELDVGWYPLTLPANAVLGPAGSNGDDYENPLAMAPRHTTKKKKGSGSLGSWGDSSNSCGSTSTGGKIAPRDHKSPFSNDLLSPPVSTAVEDAGVETRGGDNHNDDNEANIWRTSSFTVQTTGVRRQGQKGNILSTNPNSPKNNNNSTNNPLGIFLQTQPEQSSTSGSSSLFVAIPERPGVSPPLAGTDSTNGLLGPGADLVRNPAASVNSVEYRAALKSGERVEFDAMATKRRILEEKLGKIPPLTDKRQHECNPAQACEEGR